MVTEFNSLKEFFNVYIQFICRRKCIQKLNFVEIMEIKKKYPAKGAFGIDEAGYNLFVDFEFSIVLK